MLPYDHTQILYRHFPDYRIVRKNHLTVRSNKKFFKIYYLYRGEYVEAPGGKSGNV